MTKRWLFRWVFLTIGVYCAAILIGIVLKYFFPEKDDPIYNTFKDLIPFVIAIPAAWLGYCFSRRLAYLQHLRTLWAQLNIAVQKCFQYTHQEAPTQNQYGEVLTNMSTVIDEIRGAFKNIGERPGKRGLYPFEEIKLIRKIVSDLGFGDQYDVAVAEESRKKIVKHWKRVQEPFLSEFDREEPTYPSSPYINDNGA